MDEETVLPKFDDELMKVEFPGEVDPNSDEAIKAKALYLKITSLSKELSIPEPDALALYGYMLQLHKKTLDVDTVVASVRFMAAKDLHDMEPIEKKILIHAGVLRVKHAPFKATPKVSRNALCPCGSGKKYKQCCIDLVRLHDLERYKNGN